MYTTQAIMADTHGYIDNKNNTNHHSIPDDERLHLMDADIIVHTAMLIRLMMKATKQASKTAKYCALHINIHILPSKFDQLKHMISRLKDAGITVHFIMLCDTFWFDANADRFNIPGYCFVHKSRKSISRGGVALYISTEFHLKLRPDLCINIEGEFECTAAEIEAKRGKRNLIIAEIYIIPNTSERESISRYETVMTNLCNTNNSILVRTDQNFDYMKTDTNANVSDILNALFTLGALPTVPTRVTHSSATLVDRMYVKCERYERLYQEHC